MSGGIKTGITMAMVYVNMVPQMEQKLPRAGKVEWIMPSVLIILKWWRIMRAPGQWIRNR